MIRRFLLVSLATISVAACSLFGGASGSNSAALIAGAYTALTEVRTQALSLLEAGVITADQAEATNRRADELRRILDNVAERVATVPEDVEGADTAVRRTVGGALALESCVRDAQAAPAGLIPCVEEIGRASCRERV